MTDREHMRALCEDYLKITRWVEAWEGPCEKDDPPPSPVTIERREFCKRFLERA